MDENFVAIRCSSDMNRWMDGIMIVPREQSEKIADRFRKRFADFWKTERGFGDVFQEVAKEFGNAYIVCDYDEETDEPLETWEAYCDRVYRRMQVIQIDI